MIVMAFVIGVAHADAPDPFRIGAVAHGRVVATKVASHRITLELASDSTKPATVEVPLALIAQLHVVGMTVTVDARTTRAKRLAAVRYDSRDSATLRQTVVTATSNQLLLRVSDTQHAVVTLELGSGPAVDDNASLVIEDTPLVVMPTIASEERGIGARTIRRYVQLHIPRLASCYQHELFGHPTLEGRAVLHFTIRPSGRVEDISVDGTLDSQAVVQCLEDELASWSFFPTQDATRVNYPLTFRR